MKLIALALPFAPVLLAYFFLLQPSAQPSPANSQGQTIHTTAETYPTAGGTITGEITYDQDLTFMYAYPERSDGAEIHVKLYDTSGNLVDYHSLIHTSGWKEKYEFTNLPPGAYRLEVESANYHRQYYREQPSLDLATPVTVITGEVTANINVQLALKNQVASMATSRGVANTLVLTMRHRLTPFYSADAGWSWQAIPATPWVIPSIGPHVPGYNGLQSGLAPRSSGGDSRIIVALDTNYAAQLDAGMYRSGDDGQNWAQIESPDPIHGWQCYTSHGEMRFNSLTVSPVDPQRLYAAQYCVDFQIMSVSTLYKLWGSRDAGVTWELFFGDIVMGVPRAKNFTVASPIDAERVYFYSGNHWNQSDDGGATWQAKTNFPLELVLDPEQTAWLYGVDIEAEQRVGKRSQNGGASWQAWAQQPCPHYDVNNSLSREDFLQIMAHPTQTQVLFLRCKQWLFRSSDGGDSWHQIAETPGQLLAPDYGTPGRILWAKDDGLWASSDNGESWRLLLPDYDITQTRPPLSLFLPAIVTD